MDSLKHDLDNLNEDIKNLESEIAKAESEAQNNVKPLEDKLQQLKEDKRIFASKNDFESVQNCRRREDNIKFRISAQWNRYSLLKEELSKLNNQRKDLETKIKLEEDKIKRNNEILAQMDIVLNNYKKSQSLKQAALDSNINPNYVKQWFKWGEDNLNQTYSHFYNEIIKIDNHFKELESLELRRQMDEVIEAYGKTKSLKESSKIANVSYDTVQYWHEWGSRGFGEENTYFYRQIDAINRLSK